jgi:hypothetical protein
MLSNSRSLVEYFAWQRPRMPALAGRAAVWRTATLAGCVLAVGVAVRVGHPAPYLDADPALAHLLRGMAVIKAFIALGCIGAVLWRLGWALSVRAAVGYAAGSSLLAGSTMLIWQLTWIVPAALVFHAAALGMLILGACPGIGRGRDRSTS